MAKLIGPSRYHRTLNGVELNKRRDKMKPWLSQAEFAERCGWSQQHQQQLEAPELHEITIDAAEKIMKVFS